MNAYMNEYEYIVIYVMDDGSNRIASASRMRPQITELASK